ncbi:hypothetical protein PoB_006215800 [Plakobranchus ocellatus]|uniref:Uncharacterized protein n=1 Tax=Plakobranchus ocellatus TaxID=259542 RepID=A0AAV4CUR7_9GAST|nr:hypothetical protein PoB_006215800 [Plakobranchus ocellatus]
MVSQHSQCQKWVPKHRILDGAQFRRYENDLSCGSGHGGMAGKILCLSPSLNIFTKRKALQQNLKHRRIKRLP